MDWLRTTTALYGRVLRRALTLTTRNWPIAGSIFLYGLIMLVALQIAVPLGFVGGFLISLAWAACASSLLYVVETLIRANRVTLADFGQSFGAYLWDVVGVLFLLWVLFVIVTPALGSFPQGPAILLGLQLVILVFFNAVPELIYLGHHSALDLLRESYAFIGENWVEWFPANLAMLLLLALAGSLSPPSILVWLHELLLALVIYLTMVIRGLLFLELYGTSRRGRAFRNQSRS